MFPSAAKLTSTISLKSLKVNEKEGHSYADELNLLVASLFYPSPGNPEPTIPKDLKFRLENKIDYDNEVDTKTGNKRYGYFQKLLFKENILGKTLMIVLVYKKTGKLTEFLNSFFGGVLKAGWGILTGQIANVILKAAAVSVTEQHYKIQTEDKNVVAKGIIELDSNLLEPEKAIELEVTRDRKEQIIEIKSSGPEKRIIEYKEDEVIGVLKIGIEVIK